MSSAVITEGDINSVVSQASSRMDVTRRFLDRSQRTVNVLGDYLEDL